MPTVRDITSAIEQFAPLSLQESYDNAGLQVGNPEAAVNGVLVCLDVTEQAVDEALHRGCNMVVSHHPILFGGLKSVTTLTERGRIVMKAIKHDVAIYAAHTNLDRAHQGVSMEIASILGLRHVRVLQPDDRDTSVGLGAIGDVEPQPALEFLRKVKEELDVKNLRYSASFSSLIVRRVAVCGGAGASLIKEAVAQGADVMITGDVKYHDFTTWGSSILIADAGHYESELCTKKLLSHLLADAFDELPVHMAEEEFNPINVL